MKLLADRNKLVHKPPKRIIWSYTVDQPLHKELKHKMPEIEFVYGLPEDILDKINPSEGSFLILDDAMFSQQRKEVAELFIKGAHHYKLGLIMITQQIFGRQRYSRTISTNVSNIVLMKQRADLVGVDILGRQLFPKSANFFMQVYSDATKSAFSYLFITLKPDFEEDLRLLTGVFADETPYAYVKRKPSS